jgi:hypothetical protein
MLRFGGLRFGQFRCGSAGKAGRAAACRGSVRNGRCGAAWNGSVGWCEVRWVSARQVRRVLFW